MTPRLQRVGESATPVVIVDEASGDVGELVETACALAPFPLVGDGNYPGLRRFITAADAAADAYVERTLAAIAPYLGGAFDAASFDLVHASFSIVTTAPDRLTPQQRAPHFDSTDPRRLAVLHYLSGVEGSGTAFFRQRATGIERVEERNVDRFVTAARAGGGEGAGYIAGSTPAYEEIGRVEAVPDRLVIYPSALLHSGLIPAAATLDPDPRRGRLTANIFIDIHGRAE